MWVVAFLAAGLLAAMSCSEDTKSLGHPVADIEGADFVPDGAARDSKVTGPEVVPDGTQTGVDTAGEEEAGVSDGGPEDVQDATFVEAVEQDGGAEEPFQPFAECSTTQQCPFKQEPLCLLLPDSNEGLCVKECGKGGEECPPWLECVAIDPNDIGFAVCLTVAELNEKCSNKHGTTCRSGLYCVTAPGEEWGLCTSYCVPGEAICQAGTECKSVDPNNPQADWGACLPMDDFAGCQAQAECGDGKVCVNLVAGDPRCLQKCEPPGTPCGTFGTCEELDVPGGGTAAACVTYQSQGQVCKPSIALVCKPGLWCADVSAPDAFLRCLTLCPDGICPSGSICRPVAGVPGDACVPLQFALENPAGCNNEYPCPEDGHVCVPVPGQTAGVCASSCADGCPDGTTCQSGGCIVLSPSGGSCLEKKGVYCSAGTACVRDAGEQGPGWCAPECPGGQGCESPLTCQIVTNGKKVCLDPAPEGSLCSWDEGIGCAGEDVACIHLSSQNDNGFCTSTCDGPGTCKQVLPGTFPECMIVKGGKKYCALLCGGMASDCPDWMECSGMGMCVP